MYSLIKIKINDFFFTKKFINAHLRYGTDRSFLKMALLMNIPDTLLGEKKNYSTERFNNTVAFIAIINYIHKYYTVYTVIVMSGTSWV